MIKEPHGAYDWVNRRPTKIGVNRKRNNGPSTIDVDGFEEYVIDAHEGRWSVIVGSSGFVVVEYRKSL